MRIPDHCPLPPGSTVWAYLRDSGGEAQDRSVDQQIAFANAYCEKHHLILDEIFADRARQGDNAENRADLNRMLDQIEARFKRIHDRKRREDVKTQLQHGILFWSFARLGRDSIESGSIRYDLRMRGLTVISLGDDILTSNAAIDGILEALLDFKNQQDLDVISRESKRGIHFAVSLRDTHPDIAVHNPGWQPTGRYLGIFPGRIAPRGHRFEKITIGTRRNGMLRIVQRLVPDEAIWDRVILAWKMRVEQQATVPKIHEVTHLYRDINGYANFFRNRIYTGVFDYGGEVYGTPDDPFVQPAIPVDWYELEAERRARRWDRRSSGRSGWH